MNWSARAVADVPAAYAYLMRQTVDDLNGSRKSVAGFSMECSMLSVRRGMLALLA